MDQDAMNHQYPVHEWGDGPWTTEPHRVEFRSEDGVPCLLVRNHSGAWCGYAACPPGHPWHGVKYDAAPDGSDDFGSSLACLVDVHGGLTYSAKCAGHVCHAPAPGEPEDVWWLGFDTAHSGDLVPAHAALGLGLPGHGTYKDLAYARAETERLAAQVHAAGAVR